MFWQSHIMILTLAVHDLIDSSFSRPNQFCMRDFYWNICWHDTMIFVMHRFHPMNRCWLVPVERLSRRLYTVEYVKFSNHEIYAVSMARPQPVCTLNILNCNERKKKSFFFFSKNRNKSRFKQIKSFFIFDEKKRINQLSEDAQKKKWKDQKRRRECDEYLGKQLLNIKFDTLIIAWSSMQFLDSGTHTMEIVTMEWV